MNISHIRTSIADQSFRTEDPDNGGGEESKDTLGEIREYYKNHHEPISLGINRLIDSRTHEKLEEIKNLILKENIKHNEFNESLGSLSGLQEIDYTALIDSEFQPKNYSEKKENSFHQYNENIKSYRDLEPTPSFSQENILKKELEAKERRILLLEKEINDLKAQTSNISSPSFTPKKHYDEQKPQNNTSSSLYLPSEIKNNWNNFVSNELVTVFADFFEHPLITVNLIQDLVLVCMEYANHLILDKQNKIIELLNLGNTQHFDITKYFQRVFQDYNNVIFPFNEKVLSDLKKNYGEKCLKILQFDYKNELSNFSDHYTEDKLNSLVMGGDVSFDGENQFLDYYPKVKNYEEELIQILGSTEIQRALHSLYDICISILLHDPPLRIPIEPFEERKFQFRKFNKNDFVCVDGFARDGATCLMILPPIFRKEKYYNGIKPTVMILPTEAISSKIIFHMESYAQNQAEKDQRKYEKSTSGKKDLLEFDPHRTEMSPISLATDHELITSKPNETDFINMSEPFQFTLARAFSITDNYTKIDKDTNLLNTKGKDNLEALGLSKEQIIETLKEKLKLWNHSEKESTGKKNFLDEEKHSETCPGGHNCCSGFEAEKLSPCYLNNKLAGDGGFPPEESLIDTESKFSTLKEDFFGKSPEKYKKQSEASHSSSLSRIENLKLRIRSNLDHKLKKSSEFESYNNKAQRDYSNEPLHGYKSDRIPDLSDLIDDCSPVPKNIALRNNIGKIVHQSTIGKFKTQRKIQGENMTDFQRFCTPNEVRKLDFSSEDYQDGKITRNGNLYQNKMKSMNKEVMKEKDVNSRIINAVKSIYQKLN